MLILIFPATESVDQFSSLRSKFEATETDNYYEKVTAPKRKDFGMFERCEKKGNDSDYDENGNHDEVLVRTPGKSNTWMDYQLNYRTHSFIQLAKHFCVLFYKLKQNHLIFLLLWACLF